MPRRSGYVRIDTSELLCEVDDDDLLDEVAARKLTPSGDHSYDSDFVREAWHELRIGRPAEAFAILERMLCPKWAATAKCAEQYELTRKSS